ncbi:hypothetical protein L218DRAFT_30123 [Marasmius fiardii PR-910]|nr:hypothetical protein L218DRAFT_30123 [Marasmius fiardii PR-910]
MVSSCKLAARYAGTKHSDCPNEVIVRLQSDILIPDYSRYYDTPIADFKGPSYRPLDDGSLVTETFVHDLRNAHITLIVLVILAVVFLRNSFVSANYIRRARIRQKSLFYLLHLSQLFGCAGTVPQIVSFFQRDPNCSAVILVVSTAAPISISILMTGILGFKAYKCLEDSLLVAVTLFVLLAGYVVATVLDLIHVQGVQKLSGNCARMADISFTRITFILEFIQSVFLCLCFFFAVWKSRGSPTCRTRISQRLSFEDSRDEPEEDPIPSASYGLAASREHVHVESRSGRNSNSFNLLNIFPRFWTVFSGSSYKKRPASLTSEHLLFNASAQPAKLHPMGRATKRLSLAPSSFSRISRYVPRMQLFRKVMKDELCYTLAITSTYVVSTVLSVIGINFQSDLPVVGWIGLNWIIVSLLAMHSFGRVIRRHEKEALIQRVLLESGSQNGGSTGHCRMRHTSYSTRTESGTNFEAYHRDNVERQSFSGTSKESNFMVNESSRAPSKTFDRISSIASLSIPSPAAVSLPARTHCTPSTNPH